MASVQRRFTANPIVADMYLHSGEGWLQPHFKTHLNQSHLLASALTPVCRQAGPNSALTLNVFPLHHFIPVQIREHEFL